MSEQKLANGLGKCLKAIKASKDVLWEPLNEKQLQKCLSWRDTNEELLQKRDDRARAQAMETCTKLLLEDYVSTTRGNGSNKADICKLLDCVLYFAEQERCEFALVHILLEDVFEIETIEWCQEFWDFVTSREERLCQNLVGNRSPGTALIRYCNKLMRRLSKNQHAQFSGTIAMFLARAFPLNERSGLNIRGEFDTDNVTDYEVCGSEKDEGDDGDQVMGEGERDAEKQGEEDNDAEMKEEVTQTPKEIQREHQKQNEKKEQDELYDKFWSIQSIFMDPTQLFELNVLESFKTKLNAVLAELKQRDQQTAKQKGDKRRGDGSETPSVESDEVDDVFVPKWLTKRDLFDLQMNDISFRRTVLAQVAILCEFMLSLSRERKKNWAEFKNKSVMYSFTLSDQDYDYFKKKSSQLRDNIHNGRDLYGKFRMTLRAVLTSDRVWQKWKLQSCPSFENEQLDPSMVEDAEERLERHKQPRKKFWHAMGTPGLTKIWKVETGIGKFEKPRFEIPEAQIYHQTAVNKHEQRKTLQGSLDQAEDKEEAQSKLESLVESLACTQWRGLRAARSQGYWSKFNQVDQKRGLSGLFMTAEEFEEHLVEDKVQEQNKEANEKPTEQAEQQAEKGDQENSNGQNETPSQENNNEDVTMADGNVYNDGAADDSVEEGEENKDDEHYETPGAKTAEETEEKEVNEEQLEDAAVSAKRTAEEAEVHEPVEGEPSRVNDDTPSKRQRHS